MKFTKLLRNLILITLASAILVLGGISAAAESVTPEDQSDTGATDESTATPNPFEDIYTAVGEFSSEILSLLTFIGSLIVAFAYKRGLLPTVKNGIGAIGGAVGQLKTATEDCSKHQERILKEFTERLETTEEVLISYATTIEEMAKIAESSADAAKDRAAMKTLMNAQIDMLYDIFMTSSLPQYQKDAVGERIREMKEVSAANEVGN